MNKFFLVFMVLLLTSCGFSSGKKINHIKTYKNFGKPMKLISSEECKPIDEASILSFDGEVVKEINSDNFSSWNINGSNYRFPIRTVLKGIKLNYFLKESCRSMVHNPWVISGNCIDRLKQDKEFWRVQNLQYSSRQKLFKYCS